ncbi:uncharacterized protein VTP21DRAFT_1893 [Calcarisporiella thermophila]|uniref:uncharacterized protein n=1 Tax=Calcarisporiella thermophila TaxID=911321 RepID=UPI0037421624
MIYMLFLLISPALAAVSALQNHPAMEFALGAPTNEREVDFAYRIERRQSCGDSPVTVWFHHCNGQRSKICEPKSDGASTPIPVRGGNTCLKGITLAARPGDSCNWCWLINGGRIVGTINGGRYHDLTNCPRATAVECGRGRCENDSC